jgi:ribosomal RNA-processing protein 7
MVKAPDLRYRKVTCGSDKIRARYFSRTQRNFKHSPSTAFMTTVRHMDSLQKKMSKLPPRLGEYDILPISIPSVPSFPVKATHCLYIKHHEPKITTPNVARSLFLVNIPIDSTEEHFRAIFTTLIGAGRFESVIFENEKRPSTLTPTVDTGAKKDKNLKRKRGVEGKTTDSNVGQLPKVWDRDLHRSGSTAVAVMVDQKSAEAALKAIRKVHKSGAYPVWGAGVEEKVPKLGSERYLTHHILSYPDKSVLQASVDTFMTEFNRREEEAARVAKRLRNVPDEDGFVTVTRGGRTGPARREEAEEARRKELEKEEQKRKSMGDFYRFQGRERRKEEQGELVRRFEEDRKRVENMRKERKGRFMPE